MQSMDTTNTDKITLPPLNDIINRAVKDVILDHAAAIGYLQSEGAISENTAWKRLLALNLKRHDHGSIATWSEIKAAYTKNGGPGFDTEVQA